MCNIVKIIVYHINLCLSKYLDYLERFFSWKMIGNKSNYYFGRKNKCKNKVNKIKRQKRLNFFICQSIEQKYYNKTDIFCKYISKINLYYYCLFH